MRKSDRYNRMPISEQCGFERNIDNQYTEIVCKTSFGLRKYAAHKIGLKLFEVAFYDKLMRHWIRTELGVDIPCIREVMEKTCWGCDQENDDLKHCKGN